MFDFNKKGNLVLFTSTFTFLFVAFLCRLSNNLLIKVQCYDKKIYKMMLKQFIKIKQVYIKEEINET